MISLGTTNTFLGKAGTLNAITYTITGDEVTTSDSFKVLSQGQLSTSAGVLYTVPASTQTLIKEVILANVTALAVTGVTFYINGSSASNQINAGFTIPANGTAIYADGWKVYDINGSLLETVNITLIGDVTGTGTGSIPTVLATVNSNVGSFGTASQVPTQTVNAKGLTTAIVNTPIQITESQVTNLTSDLSAKVDNTRTISTTAPLTGGGDLSANRTLALTTTPAGQTPVGATRNINTTAPLTGGGDLSADRTLALTTNPVGQTPVGVTRNINTTSPITGGGDLSTDRTLALTTSPVGQVPVGVTRTITATSPIQIAGGTSADLSVDRTISILPATTSIPGSMSASDKKQLDDMWYDIVADGGADPTGVVDATSIISTAISTVAAAGGGIVFIPIGTYKVTSTITISGNYVTVRGASRVASKLVPTFATGNIFTISGIFNRFEYIRIEPASSSLRTSGYAMEFTSSASNCGCQWVDILFMWSAVKMTGQLCRLEDMNIRECGYNAINGQIILIDSFTDQYINKIVTDANPASLAAGFAGVRITNLSSLIMTDCQIIHSGNSLDVIPSGSNTIPSIYCANTFFDNSTIGANFSSAAGIISRCRFIQCWFSSATTAGVVLNCANLSGIDFVSCDFYGSPIGIDAQLAMDWAVRSSRIAGNTTAGIRTTANANHSFTIADNNIGSSGGFGVNGVGINVQAGTYKRYQILDNRGLDANTTKGIIDLGTVAAIDQKNVANNMGTVLKGAIATLAAPLSVPVTTETLVLNARIPAGGVSVGQVFRIKAIGVMAGANAPTWRVKVGALGTAAGDTACWTATAAVGVANGRHGCDVLLTVRSLGAPGSVNAEGLAQSGTTTTAITWAQPTLGAATTTAATTTADWFIDVTLSQTINSSLIQEAIIEAL